MCIDSVIFKKAAIDFYNKTDIFSQSSLKGVL